MPAHTPRTVAGLEAARRRASDAGHVNRALELEQRIVETPIASLADAAALARLLDELLEGSDLYPDGRDRQAATALAAALTLLAGAD